MNIDKLADYIPQESPFGYCMNNPILYIDPLGLSSEKLPYNLTKRLLKKIENMVQPYLKAVIIKEHM